MLKSDEFDGELENLIKVASEIGLCNEGDGFPIPTKYKLKRGTKLQIEDYKIEILEDGIEIERDKITARYKDFDSIIFFRSGFLINYGSHYRVKVFNEDKSESPQFAIIKRNNRFYIAEFKS